MTPVHTYPLSVDQDDLIHNPATISRGSQVEWTRNRPIKGCPLCAQGMCLQRVETMPCGGVNIVHGLAQH